MPELNYELAPQQGMSASQRKAQLDQARYVAVRNLAHLVYKKADGSPLMTFGETLDDRDHVKNTIISYEITAGLVSPDGSAQMAVPVAAFSPSPTQVPLMAPVGPPPGNGAYQQQPQMSVAPVATPQAAAAAGQGASQEPPAPAGRARRGRVGVGVAPPPPAPAEAPPAPQMGVMATPAPAAFPVQASFNPAIFAPVAQPTYTQPATPQTGPEFSSILVKLDALGQGLSDIALDGEELKKTLKFLFAAVHHLYLVDPALAKNADAQKAQTLAAFESYLTRFIGNP